MLILNILVVLLAIIPSLNRMLFLIISIVLAIDFVLMFFIGLFQLKIKSE